MATKESEKMKRRPWTTFLGLKLQNAWVQGRTFGPGKDQYFDAEDFIADLARRDLPFGKGGGPKGRICNYRVDPEPLLQLIGMQFILLWCRFSVRWKLRGVQNGGKL